MWHMCWIKKALLNLPFVNHMLSLIKANLPGQSQLQMQTLRMIQGAKLKTRSPRPPPTIGTGGQILPISLATP